MKSIIFSIALLSSSCVYAQSTFTSFINLKCGEYVNADEYTKHQYGTMVLSFITGTNYIRGRMTENSYQPYLVWIDEYCKKNPFGEFSHALIALDVNLGEGSKKYKAGK